MSATVRIADSPIRVHGQSRNPDAVVVFDARLLQSVDVTAGLKEGGLLLVNSPGLPEGFRGKPYRLGAVDATRISLEMGLVISGFPLVNAAMVGATVRATGVSSLNSAVQAAREVWETEVGDRNVAAMCRAYEELVMDVVRVV